MGSTSLDGWRQDGGPGPALKLSSMYVDQFTGRDMARPQSKKHNVPIFDTIEGALTVGGDRLAVDGVISIGEHGDYPYNKKQQHLDPRRRFFEQITDAFVKHGRVVPVFSDKHLGPEWADASWRNFLGSVSACRLLARDTGSSGGRRQDKQIIVFSPSGIVHG